MARGVSEAEANLGSLDMVIVTEEGGGDRWGPALLCGVALQVLGLQRLHVVLVDFERWAELYRQPRQHVIARHQQQGLAVDFLSGRGRDIRLRCVFSSGTFSGEGGLT